MDSGRTTGAGVRFQVPPCPRFGWPSNTGGDFESRDVRILEVIPNSPPPPCPRQFGPCRACKSPIPHGRFRHSKVELKQK